MGLRSTTTTYPAAAAFTYGNNGGGGGDGGSHAMAWADSGMDRCRHCKTLNLPGKHWNRDCPNKKAAKEKRQHNALGARRVVVEFVNKRY